MIVKEYFYNVRCDCCGETLGNEELWRPDKEYAYEDAYDEGDFKDLGGKDYCPNCWKYNADGNIVTKDGKVWDADTEEEILI